MQALLRESLPALGLSIVIITVALATFALFLLRLRSRERILFWFAMLSSLYGVRLLAMNPLPALAYGAPQGWRFVVDSISFLITVPFVLFFEELFGGSWRPLLRRAAWALGVYAVAAIVVGLLTGGARHFPDPALPLLLPGLALIGLIGYFRGYRLPSMQDGLVLLLGILVFQSFVLIEHFGPQSWRAEPLGFVAFICALGFVAARRASRNEQKLRSVEREMASARAIQSSILPCQEPQLPGVRVAVRYEPMAEVAGDFYDFAILDDHRFGILVADVTGHGVPAALIASMVKVAFASQEPDANDPARVMAGLNQVLCSQLGGQFVTAAYVLIDTVERTALYSGAGHPPVIVWRHSSQTLDSYEENGLLLGFHPDAHYANLTIPLCSGDRLMLYTDGLVEAGNAAGEMFGDHIDAHIAAHAALPASIFADALLKDVSAWSSRQEDDLTLLVADIA